ncbi:hypothetical protein GMOD_00005117 [Pyrenophora seminiperda CCB06]|uniref:Uncharacterized protein n=1 Tax=Pyrenophora seminiperda CCB06 TaxID=1302712 RepID=A0A3M7LV25_9PLEO|nr:hypothetical protein GMOD_00005117 [Pyrenophora seminiperda CCB06]
MYSSRHQCMSSNELSFLSLSFCLRAEERGVMPYRVSPRSGIEYKRRVHAEGFTAGMQFLLKSQSPCIHTTKPPVLITTSISPSSRVLAITESYSHHESYKCEAVAATNFTGKEHASHQDRSSTHACMYERNETRGATK